MIDTLKLLSGDSIFIDGIGLFKQPKLKEIKTIGMNTYYSYISFLFANTEQYLESINRKDLIPIYKEKNISMFDICKNNIQEQYWLIKALSFFIDGQIKFDKNEFVLNDKLIINADNYSKILIIISQLNYFELQNKEEIYANDKARQIAERMQQAKEKRKNIGNKDTILIDCIISAVASKHPSLNLLNIWDLTVYQLYDQYERLFMIDSYEIQAMNYAFCGGELKADWSKPLK